MREGRMTTLRGFLRGLIPKLFLREFTARSPDAPGHRGQDV
ncbi:hypothetical protein [Amycolatopsis sp. GA6-003]